MCLLKTQLQIQLENWGNTDNVIVFYKIWLSAFYVKLNTHCKLKEKKNESKKENRTNYRKKERKKGL